MNAHFYQCFPFTKRSCCLTLSFISGHPQIEAKSSGPKTAEDKTLDYVDMDIDDEDETANNAQEAAGKNDVTSGLPSESIEKGLDVKEMLNETSNRMIVENSQILPIPQVTIANT